MSVHDPDLSTFTSAGVDRCRKHTQGNALPMGIHFNTSFGQASISRSSLCAFFLVVCWVLCLSGWQQGLQPPQSISPLLWGSSCITPISLFGSVMLVIFGWKPWVDTSNNPRGKEYKLPNTPSLSDRKTVHRRKPELRWLTGHKTCGNQEPGQAVHVYLLLRSEVQDATGRLGISTPAWPQQPPQTTAPGAALFQGAIAELDPELSWRRRC